MPFSQTSTSTPSLVCPYLTGGCPLFSNERASTIGSLTFNSRGQSPRPPLSPLQTGYNVAASPSGCTGGCGGGSKDTHPLGSPPLVSIAGGPSGAYPSLSSRVSPSPPTPTYPLPLLSFPSPEPTPEVDPALWSGPYVDFGFATQEPGPSSSSYYNQPPPPPPSHYLPYQSAPSPPYKRSSQPTVDIEDLVSQSQVKRSRPDSVDSGYTSGGYSPEASEWANGHHNDDHPATPFVSKLVYILAHPHQFGGLVSWTADGQSILLAHAKPETLEILSKFFRHSTVASFVRQLNIYAFKRLSTTDLLAALDDSLPQPFNASDYSAFCNPSFWRTSAERGAPSLSTLKPIAKERASRAKKAGGAASARAKKQAQPSS